MKEIKESAFGTAAHRSEAINFFYFLYFCGTNLNCDTICKKNQLFCRYDKKNVYLCAQKIGLTSRQATIPNLKQME
jgi:hypothetical protein